MAIYGKEMTVCYIAWDSAAGAYKTGDSANHTLRWIKDGISSAPANSNSEVDSTNAPGVYKVTITSTEASTPFGVLAGKSSTANVVIGPVSVSFERTPDAAPGAAGGIPTADASNRVKSDLEAIDGQTTSANNATLNLKQLNVSNGTGSAIVAASSAGSGYALSLSANGSGGGGLRITAPSTGSGISITGPTSTGHAVSIDNAAPNYSAVILSASGKVVHVEATGSNGDAVYLKGSGSGSGERVVAGATGNALELTAPAGTALSSIGETGATFDSSSANGVGINVFGRGDQNALNVFGGDTGDGAVFSGGSGVDIRGDITGNLLGDVTGSVTTALALGSGAITGPVLDDTALDAIRNKFLVLSDSLNGPTVGANTVTLSSIYAANDDAFNGMFGVHLNASNQIIQTFVVTDYVNSPTPTLTVTPNWAIAPVDTDIIRIYESAVGSVNISSSGSDSILDSADAIETGLTMRGALRIITAALSGKLSGAGTTTVTIRNYGDTKNRITATVDTDGNRSAVTTDVT